MDDILPLRAVGRKSHMAPNGSALVGLSILIPISDVFFFFAFEFKFGHPPMDHDRVRISPKWSISYVLLKTTNYPFETPAVFIEEGLSSGFAVSCPDQPHSCPPNQNPTHVILSPINPLGSHLTPSFRLVWLEKVPRSSISCSVQPHRPKMHMFYAMFILGRSSLRRPSWPCF